MPSPLKGRYFMSFFAIAAVGLFIALTSAAWISFERDELSGLRQSLDSISERSRVLGLYLVHESKYIRWAPFMQEFAYAQVFKGSDINFSFAEHATGIVRYRGPREAPWTNGLEWEPNLVTERDVLLFDYVLVNGDNKIHFIFTNNPILSTSTKGYPWRLYKVKNIMPPVR